MKWVSASKGVRYREHKTRRHGKRLDRYWVLQYKKGGKVYNEAVGWWSDGFKQSDCEALLSLLRRNWKMGQGAQCLRDLRQGVKFSGPLMRQLVRQELRQSGAEFLYGGYGVQGSYPGNMPTYGYQPGYAPPMNQAGYPVHQGGYGPTANQAGYAPPYQPGPQGLGEQREYSQGMVQGAGSNSGPGVYDPAVQFQAFSGQPGTHVGMEPYPTGEGDERESIEPKRVEQRPESVTITTIWEVYDAAMHNRSSRRTDVLNFKYLQRFHHMRPEDIRTPDVDMLRVELTDTGKKPQTVRHVLALLRRLIRYGARRDLCALPDRLYFDMPRVDNQKTECLTPEQAQRLLSALDQEDDQNLAALMRLALSTGMRKGALLALRWDDLDFERGFITLRGASAKKGKTEVIPMTAQSRVILQSIDRTDLLYVFPGREPGTHRTNIDRMVQRIKEKAQLPDDFRPLHGLRHTYASWLASSGQVDLYTLQRLLTHESPQMTTRYAHLADNAMRRAADVADSLYVAASPKFDPDAVPVVHVSAKSIKKAQLERSKVVKLERIKLAKKGVQSKTALAKSSSVENAKTKKMIKVESPAQAPGAASTNAPTSEALQKDDEPTT